MAGFRLCRRYLALGKMGAAVKTFLFVLFLLLIAGVLVSGCCDQVLVFPAGAYVARGTEGEIILDFEEKGVYTAVLAGDSLITEGAYRPTVDTITFSAAPPCAEEADYLWVRDGERLTFELVGEDSCSDRRAFLEALTYTCVTCT